MARNSIGNLSVVISASTRGLTAALRSAQRSIEAFRGVASRVSSSIQAVNPFSEMMPSLNQLKTVGAASLTALSGYAVKLAADAETTQQAFSVMLGDANRAKVLIESIRGFAAETPFGSTELINASRQLLAYGTQADQIVPTLRLLGDAASASQIPIGELVYLYGTLQTQGRAFSKDINQFTGRGIPILEELAKVLGVSQAEVMTLVEDGKVGFREIAMSFQNMTREGSRFGGLMEKQSRTLVGLFEQLRDNITLALMDVGQVIIEEFNLKGLVQDGIDFTQNIKRNIESIRPFIREIASWAKAIANAFVVGFRSAMAAGEGFFQGLSTVLDFGKQAGSIKDFFAGLKFDFYAARDFGINMAEGISLAVAKIVDVVEEVVQSIRRMYIELLKVDMSAFALKRGLNPDDGPDRRIRDSVRDFNFEQQLALDQSLNDLKKGAALQRTLIDDATGKGGGLASTASRNSFIERVAKIAAPLAKDMAKVSDELDATGEVIDQLNKVTKLEPNNQQAQKALKERTEEYRKTLAQFFELSREAEKVFNNTREKTSAETVSQMEREIKSIEKSIDERGKTVGQNADAISKKFDNLRRSISLKDVATIAGQSFSSLVRVTETAGQQLADAFVIPMRVANNEQIQLAKQLTDNMKSPVAELRKEYEKLKDLLEVRAFGEPNIGAQLLGGGGINGGRGVDEIAVEMARRFRDIERGLGDNSPRLTGAALRNSVDAASIESQFSVRGSTAVDPQQRIEQVLQRIEKIQSEELQENKALGRALMKYLQSQGVADIKGN